MKLNAHADKGRINICPLPHRGLRSRAAGAIFTPAALSAVAQPGRQSVDAHVNGPDSALVRLTRAVGAQHLNLQKEDIINVVIYVSSGMP